MNEWPTREGKKTGNIHCFTNNGIDHFSSKISLSISRQKREQMINSERELMKQLVLKNVYILARWIEYRNNLRNLWLFALGPCLFLENTHYALFCMLYVNVA